MRKERTKLIERRKPTKQEKIENDAEVVFIREDKNGRQYTIYGHSAYFYWEQWGSTKDILGDNVDDIEHWSDMEHWRNEQMTGGFLRKI